MMRRVSTERPGSSDGGDLSGCPSDGEGGLRASQVLKVKKVWLVPLALAAVFVALMAAIYIGSVVNPAGHLHGLPVVLVNEDTGASSGGKHIDVGAEVVSALTKSKAVTSRLDLHVLTLAQARAKMDRAGAYATLVIPGTLSRSLLLDTGAPHQGSSIPARASVALEENSRLGSLGVGLAAGVLTPAVQAISKQLGSRLTAQAAHAGPQNPVVAAQLADPIALATETYRPLPDHTALGLSAFYAALLAIMAGFIGGTLINSSVDAALGYASREIGPRWQQRRPMAINRLQTLLIKWVTALIAAPVLTGVLLLIAVAALGMNAPDVLLLWGLLALAALMISTGTLALLAAFGAIGQLLAMILLVYLSLASSGGTVPIQALPGIFRAVGHVEPLRQVLGGTRAILYFGARGNAGLTQSLLVIACELVFWVIVGVGFTVWYDRRGLDRISPDLLSYIERSVAQRQAEVAAAPTGER
jgi:YhgE/Pip-like protein